MKKYKYLIGIFGLILLILAFCFFFMRYERENRLMKEGNILIKKIELFRLEHKRLPNTLVDLGLKEEDGIDVLYYEKKDSINYIVHFVIDLDKSIIYFSDKKRWENKYRKME